MLSKGTFFKRAPSKFILLANYLAAMKHTAWITRARVDESLNKMLRRGGI